MRVSLRLQSTSSLVDQQPVFRDASMWYDDCWLLLSRLFDHNR